jgi:crotonobetainyl-CoA:carnitine CoA-transferase CaiB-like acyl-CoA transferase
VNFGRDADFANPLPLEGVKVIDLTHYIAGPYCSKLLADRGADVIKIERPDGGDPARRIGPFFHDEPHLEGSGLFLHLNTNKRSVTLNLKSATGRRILLDFVRDADILVENFSPRVMPSLGLDYETLERVNPKLIMTSISNFGSSGPYRDYKSNEITLYAMGGTMHSTGVHDREPIKLGMTVEQFFCGTVAAHATMGAFLGAVFHGTGQHLDLSLYEFMTGSQDRALTMISAWNYTGEMQPRHLEAASTLSPILPAQDGYVQFFNLQRIWPRVCEMIGHPELKDDPVLARADTPDAKDTITGLMLEWLYSMTKHEAMAKAQAAGIFCTALNRIEEVFSDPHLMERGFFVDIDHPHTGTLKYAGAPFHMSEGGWRAGRAPLLGEHTSEVLRGLDYSGEDIARLREQGAI